MVSVCVSYKHNSKNNYSKNSEFDILHLYRMLMQLKTFYKDRTNSLYTGAHKKFKYITARGRDFLQVDPNVLRLR